MANNINQVTNSKGEKANLGDIEKAAIAGVEQGQNEFQQAPLFAAVQRLAADEALTIGETTNLVIFAHATGGNKVITMPSAVKGRYLKILWEVEQATTDRVLTAAGNDDFVGQINCSEQGDAAGDGDVVSVTDGTVEITLKDDINIGSEINCYCGVAGQWIITGHITIDAVAQVPTIA